MKRGLTLAVLVIAVIIGTAAVFRGQDSDASSAASPAKQAWSPEQLDNLVAPVALYPDPLLGQMLVASTYPLEVVEASQWLQRNENLQGQALIDAAKQRDWDPSIQALVAVPDALQKLNEDISWTTDLGNAFLEQQEDVMSAVQRMRVRAQANGHLSSTAQQTVKNENDEGQNVIVIQPAEPDVIYVPVYDPFFVWGPPVYGFYPPLFYPSYGFGFGVGFDVGFCFGGWGGWNTWGWGPNWFGRTVFVNNYFFNHYGYHDRFISGREGRAIWRHDPVHRTGIPYANPRVAGRFGGAPMATRNTFRSSGGSFNSTPRATTRPDARFSGRTPLRGSGNSYPQAQRFQNPPRTSYQAPRQSRSSMPQNRQGVRVIPFGNQAGRNERTPQQYRSAPQVDRAPQSQRFQEAPRQNGYSMPQRSAPQIYRAPQAQRFQAPQQYRSAPQFSAPRFNGGSRESGSRGFSQGGSGGFSRGNGGGGNRRR